MSRSIGAAIAVAAILISVACAGAAPRGGVAETQLTAATQAIDLAKVKQLLAAGADPNKVVDVAGNPQSAWYLALNQLRESQRATAEIVIAMLAAGARPASAWGTSGGRPREGFWQSFFSGHRAGGTNEEDPLTIAMVHPVPAVIQAFVAAGFDPRHGAGALVEAVQQNQADIVHLLVEKGVDVNAASAAGTPLGAAIATRNVALMTYLEDHGATERGR